MLLYTYIACLVTLDGNKNICEERMLLICLPQLPVVDSNISSFHEINLPHSTNKLAFCSLDNILTSESNRKQHNDVLSGPLKAKSP